MIRAANSHQQGTSLLELMVVVSLITILLGIAIMGLRALDDPLANGAAQLSSFIKRVRSEAIATTSVYMIEASSSSQLITKTGTACSDPSPVVDSHISLALPSGVSLADPSLSVCFNSRGYPDANIEIVLHDLGAVTRTIEIMLGGGVRIL